MIGLRIEVAALLLVAALPVRADRIHLDGGGVIETGRWWYEGSSLVYESDLGTVGLPRSIVRKIEQADAPAAPAGATGSAVRTERVAPEVAGALSQAREALDARDFETAASLYAAVLAQADPDLQSPRIGYALSQIALGQDDAALGILLDGLARDPEQPTLLELLGDVRDRREQVEDALLAWRQAFGHAPGDRLRDKILKAERELAAGRSYSFSTTPHFNLRYDGQVDQELSGAMAAYLEQQYWALADTFRHAPSQPIAVLLYSTRKFREVTETPDWVGGLYDGKIRVPLGGLDRLNAAAQAVLVHELTHAVVHSKTRGQCPRWLHEGLALRAEGRTLSEADRRAVAQRLAAIEPAAWESRGFSYPLAQSLTEFLERRNGFDRLVVVLERIGAGESLDSVLVAVYGADHARLCDEWARQVLESSP